MTETPRGLRDILDAGERFRARFELPVQPGELLLSRMHPLVERLANHVLNAALDPLLEGVARRCGVIRTRQVTKRTTLLLVRYRFHIVTTSVDRQQPLLAEDSEVLAFSGSPQNAEWLPRDQAEALLQAEPEANVSPDQASHFLRGLLEGFDAIRPHLEQSAHERGAELLEAHRRVRMATRAIDAKGLHPVPNESVAANGAALSTLATVIGLDLACMTASICGLGHHPRLVVHDSPREAELESILFDRIFHLIGSLENAFGNGGNPSFQYIVTTSSQIPATFAAEPYTRLILDAREEEGLLLKARF